MDPAQYQPQQYLWSQRDLRWKNRFIGKSGLTFGDDGCALTDLNYLNNRIQGKFVSRPGDFLSWINKKAASANYEAYLTPGGQVYWNSLDEYSGRRVKNQWHPFGVGEKGYTLIQVQWGPYYQHWITALDGDLALDPWTGKIIKRKQPFWFPTGRQQYYKIV